jgi:hypothetical protein
MKAEYVMMRKTMHEESHPNPEPRVAKVGWGEVRMACEVA